MTRVLWLVVAVAAIPWAVFAALTVTATIPVPRVAVGFVVVWCGVLLAVWTGVFMLPVVAEMGVGR